MADWKQALAIAVGVALCVGAARGEGDLSLKVTELDELVLGIGEAGFGVSKKTYDLVTGKAYSLKIKSTGAKECAWEAPEFANTIWLRKVEAGDVEIKASHLTEIEFEREGEAEIFFVPIRPGNFPWRCRGLEGKGMTGAFVVK
jgi:uncharacterized cupredoxin-like copper-binding protein